MIEHFTFGIVFIREGNIQHNLAYVLNMYGKTDTVCQTSGAICSFSPAVSDACQNYNIVKLTTAFSSMCWQNQSFDTTMYVKDAGLTSMWDIK